MSLQPDFSQFYTQTLDLINGEILPQNRPLVAKQLIAYEIKIDTDQEFREAMGASMKTPQGKIFAKKIKALPQESQALALKCMEAYQKLEITLFSLSEALNHLEKIGLQKTFEYKIGLNQNGLFKLYKKGPPADLAQLFLKTEFHSLAHLFEKYKRSDHANSNYYMGKVRMDLLNQIELNNKI